MRELEKIAQISPSENDAWTAKLSAREPRLQFLRGLKERSPAFEAPPLGRGAKFQQKYVGPFKRLWGTPGGKLKILAALGALGLGGKLFSEGGEPETDVSPMEALEYANSQQPGTLGKFSSDKTAFLDEGVAPWLWGAGGGIGGLLLGNKVISPLIKMKEESIKRQIAMGETILDKLRRIRKISPIATGAIGALILASIAAKRARNKEQALLEQYGDVPAYQYGFNPSDIYQVNDPHARFY